MFREIRTTERITDQDRRRELEKNLLRIAGRHYSPEEHEEAKQFAMSLFKEQGDLSK